MTLLIISVVAFIIYRKYRNWRDQHDDGLGDVLGHATHYSECPNCARKDCQLARGRGEVITRGGNYVVRQYHVCENCGTKSLWHRRLDQWVWTINRSGVL